MSNNILVLGGTGKTGSRVVKKLNNSGYSVRVGSRSATIPFNWENAETWDKALKDITAVYITFQPDIAIPTAPASISLFVEKAKNAGVQKLVLLSGRGEQEAQVCENIVINSGIKATILRSSWFMQNFSESFLLDSIMAGEVVLPKVKALEPFVDIDDIADVVFEALVNDIHAGKTYEMTGPELLSFKEATAIISNALNRPISYQDVSMDEYVAMLKSYQLPDDFISLITYLFTEVLDGRNESIVNDIETILKRKPTSFLEYVTKTVNTGVWEKAPA
jgi:uncharacterized protein YbjT (DUF2867 family)